MPRALGTKLRFALLLFTAPLAVLTACGAGGQGDSLGGASGSSPGGGNASSGSGATGGSVAGAGSPATGGTGMGGTGYAGTGGEGGGGRECIPTSPDTGGGEWLPPDEGLWSDPATWGGVVPAAGADVTIPAGKRVVLDGGVEVKNLVVNGELWCADADVALRAESIMVHGALRCGAEQTPFRKRLTITLVGSDPSVDVMGMGAKVLGVMGGTLELHGAPRTSWARLAASAPAGATEVELECASDFAPGDQLVIASTDFDMNQAERRTVVSVAGTRVRLDAPLDYLHWGVTQRLSNGVREWTLDERAEVGLINRNIVIQGDEGSKDSGFGGHVMAMSGGRLQVANTELRWMGQSARLGRYPIHWHRLGDADGQYVRGNSIHDTYNRCVTVHGTSGVLVERNTCLDNVGHAFFLEDGTERRNVLTGNLGLVTRRPTAAQLVKERPSDVANRGNDRLGPATFWLSNPDNVVRGNVAAGSDGSGFWYGVHDEPIADAVGTDLKPSALPLLEFSGNVMHSLGGMAMVLGAAGMDGPGGLYNPAEVARFRESSYYKTRARGIWAHGHDMSFEGFIIADNVRGAFFSFDSALVDSVIVGESDNIGTPTTALELEVGRSLASKDGAVAGYVLYDGPVHFDGVFFTGFERDADNVYVFANNGAAFQRVDNRFERISIAKDTLRTYPTRSPFSDQSRDNGARHGAIFDLDGSVSGRGGRYLLPNLPFNTNENCAPGPWTSPFWVACANPYVATRYWADFGSGFGKGLVDVTVARADGPEITVNSTNDHWYTWPLIADGRARYRVRFPAGSFPKVSRIQPTGLAPATAVLLDLVDAPASYRASLGNQKLAEAASEDDLVNGAVNRQLRLGAGLLLKLAVGADVYVR